MDRINKDSDSDSDSDSVSGVVDNNIHGGAATVFGHPDIRCDTDS